MSKRVWERVALVVVGMGVGGAGLMSGGADGVLRTASAETGGIETGVPAKFINVWYDEFGSVDASASCSFAFGQNSLNYANISLPDGITLKAMRLDGSSFWNKVGSNTLVLERLDVATCAVTAIATLTMNESFTNTFREIAIADHLVDNSTGVYRIRASVPMVASLTIKRVRLAYTPPALAATCPGDNNGDNMINGADLSVLLSQFGNSCSP